MRIIRTFFVCIAMLIASFAFASPVNINTASADEIAAALSGIGEKKAQKIVDFRTKNGKFSALNELLYVKGIGPKTIKKNRDDIRFVDEER